MLYRVKTRLGYYYTQAGRRSRVTGSQHEAVLLCDVCAAELVTQLAEIAPGIEPAREAFEGHGRCLGCGKVVSQDDG